MTLPEGSSCCSKSESRTLRDNTAHPYFRAVANSSASFKTRSPQPVLAIDVQRVGGLPQKTLCRAESLHRSRSHMKAGRAVRFRADPQIPVRSRAHAVYRKSIESCDLPPADADPWRSPRSNPPWVPAHSVPSACG